MIAAVQFAYCRRNLNLIWQTLHETALSTCQRSLTWLASLGCALLSISTTVDDLSSCQQCMQSGQAGQGLQSFLPFADVMRRASMCWSVFLYALTEDVSNPELIVSHNVGCRWALSQPSGGWGASPIDLTPQQASFVSSMGRALYHDRLRRRWQGEA